MTSGLQLPNLKQRLMELESDSCGHHLPAAYQKNQGHTCAQVSGPARLSALADIPAPPLSVGLKSPS
jgi:hypothetical protein